MNTQKVETDVCVVCGEDTLIPKDRPVDLRPNYVEGAGQLCSKCWNEVYRNVK